MDITFIILLTLIIPTILSVYLFSTEVQRYLQIVRLKQSFIANKTVSTIIYQVVEATGGGFQIVTSSPGTIHQLRELDILRDVTPYAARWMESRIISGLHSKGVHAKFDNDLLVAYRMMRVHDLAEVMTNHRFTLAQLLKDHRIEEIGFKIEAVIESGWVVIRLEPRDIEKTRLQQAFVIRCGQWWFSSNDGCRWQLELRGITEEDSDSWDEKLLHEPLVFSRDTLEGSVPVATQAS